MIAILSSLLAEAEPLIEKMKLQQKEIVKGYRCFINEEKTIILMISGVGKCNASGAVSALMQNHPCDFLVFFSSCAGLKKQKTGSIYQVNKLTDLESGRTYYPDLLYQNTFQEASLITGSLMLVIHQKARNILRPYDPEIILQNTSYDLYDMDASGGAFTAAKFLGPHQVIILKVVSDQGNEINRHDFAETMHQAADAVFPFVEMLENIAENKEKKFPDFERTALQMCCSAAMHAQLEQLYRYASASGIDIQNILKEMQREKILPCASREEGKKALHEFASRLTA